MSSTALGPTSSHGSAQAGPRHALAGNGASTGPGARFLPVLHSEFIKFRTLLSTMILLGSTVLVVVGFGALSAWGAGQFATAALQDPEAAAAFAAQGGDITLGIPTSGIAFSQLILGSLGVLLMSSEFTTGMARSTFAAVPRRIPVFAAKLVLVLAATFVLTAASVYLAGLVALPILAAHDLTLDLAGAQTVKLLLASSLYVAAVAVIGLSLGALLRNSAGGIMSLVGLFFVAPIAFQLIPGDFFVQARKYLPANTVEPLTAVQHVPDTLQAWQAALVLGAWVVIPVLLAAVLLKRRDI